MKQVLWAAWATNSLPAVVKNLLTDTLREKSINLPMRKKEGFLDLCELENKLLDAVGKQQAVTAKRTIQGLVKFYNTHGVLPTIETRGRYEILEFLLHLEELITVLYAEKRGWKAA